MKVVAFQGSPRRGGKVAHLAEEVLAGAEEAGAEVEMIHLYDLGLAPCTGCMACRQAPYHCVKRDAVLVLEQALREAGGLVLASPTYWANVSAGFKTACERLSGFLIEERDGGFPRPRLGRGRGRVALVTACSAPAPFDWLANQSRAALGRMAEFAKWAGYRPGGRVVLAGSRDLERVPERLRGRARALGRGLVR